MFSLVRIQKLCNLAIYYVSLLSFWDTKRRLLFFTLCSALQVHCLSLFLSFICLILSPAFSASISSSFRVNNNNVIYYQKAIEARARTQENCKNTGHFSIFLLYFSLLSCIRSIWLFQSQAINVSFSPSLSLIP